MNVFRKARGAVGDMLAYTGVLYRKHLYTPKRRLLAGSMAGLIVITATLPAIHSVLLAQRYALSRDTQQMIGALNHKLAKHVTYDVAEDAFYFNKDNIQQPASDSGLSDSGSDEPSEVARRLKQQVGASDDKDGLPTYSSKLPIDPREGVTYYDNNTGQSFRMIPKFSLLDAREVDGRIVYPASSGMQAVYSVKANGIKEDMVLNHFIGDEVELAYDLQLPTSLEARLLEDGSGDLGIYSADLALFANISFGSDVDKEKVLNARETARKEHLAFVLPAPVIVDKSGSTNKDVTATFALREGGTVLAVHASGLSRASYPLSVDPSVVITSTSDFMSGEGNDTIDYSTADQITRRSSSGGALSGWQGTSDFSAVGSGARYGLATVAYNGYLYVTGGYSTTYLSDVLYAPINTDGSVGSWSTTSGFAGVGLGARRHHAVVAYNGYMYITGGDASYKNDTLYAKINSNGTIGAWAATSSFGTARRYHTMVANNGYLYVAGGTNGTPQSDIQRAVIRSDGTLGSWGSAGASLPSARYSHSSFVYNDYLFVAGGYNNSTYMNDVVSVKINSDGSLDSYWTTTTSFTTGRAYHTTVVRDGFVYLYGGFNGSNFDTTQYAPLYGNGRVGSWTTGYSFTTARRWHAAATYNGYIYVLGGFTSTYVADVQYSGIRAAGYVAAVSATSSFGSAGPARHEHMAVAYNGYVYILGGFNSGTSYSDVLYAPINADGTLGSWQATSSFSGVGVGQRSQSLAVAYGGYMYIMGGRTGGLEASDVLYAPINANGTLGTWQMTNDFTNVGSGRRLAHSGFAWRGYMYILGGTNEAFNIRYSDVLYAPINSNGTLGAWQTTTSFHGVGAGARHDHVSFAYNGYAYMVGGYTNTALSEVLYAPIASDGNIGTWSLTTNFSGMNADARFMHASFVVNGYVYIHGGYTNSTYTNNTKYAPILPDGSVGAWQSLGGLGSNRFGHAGVAANGYFYLIGGHNGGAWVSDVVYATPVLGDTGAIKSWHTANGISGVGNGARYNHAAVAYRGYMYVIGGYNSSSGVLSDTLYAKIGSTGTGAIASWQSTSSIDAVGSGARYGHAAFAYNGYMYVIGGFSGVYDSDVLRAPINVDGTLGTWMATSSFNGVGAGGRYEHAVMAADGYVYIVGGNNGSELSDVLYASIQSDGTLSAWQVTSSFNGVGSGPRSEHASVINAGYAYIIGGKNGSVRLGDILVAPINSDGTLGTWVSGGVIRGVGGGARSGHTVTVANGRMYMLGGYNGTDAFGDALYATIGANGHLSDWSPTISFTSAGQERYQHASVLYNGELFVIGGRDVASGVYSDIFNARLDMPVFRSRYEKILSLDGGGIASAISYGGALSDKKAAISYRVAGADGVFGSSASAYGLPDTSVVSCTASGVGAGLYLYLTVNMDDTVSTTLPDVASSRKSYLTVLTTGYSLAAPDPDTRLRGGKYFSQDELLQGLDTC